MGPNTEDSGSVVNQMDSCLIGDQVGGGLDNEQSGSSAGRDFMLRDGTPDAIDEMEQDLSEPEDLTSSEKLEQDDENYSN